MTNAERIDALIHLLNAQNADIHKMRDTIAMQCQWIVEISDYLRQLQSNVEAFTGTVHDMPRPPFQRDRDIWGNAN